MTHNPTQHTVQALASFVHIVPTQCMQLTGMQTAAGHVTVGPCSWVRGRERNN